MKIDIQARDFELIDDRREHVEHLLGVNAGVKTCHWAVKKSATLVIRAATFDLGAAPWLVRFPDNAVGH